MMRADDPAPGGGGVAGLRSEDASFGGDGVAAGTDGFGSAGEDVIIPPAVSDEQAKQKFPNGWKTIKPYLRVVAQPPA
jgi:hypothetical protein